MGRSEGDTVTNSTTQHKGPELLQSIPIDDPTGRGRRVRVRFYADGSIRLAIANDTGYGITEAYVTGPPAMGTEIRLTPIPAWSTSD
jgi:hypothetical protein